MTGRENIAVIGPPLSGATSLAAALRHRLPGASVLESCDGHVAVAVFVVSAAAPMVGSEVALLEATASRVDAVVAAVSKIDVHRTWRDVLAANRNPGGPEVPGRALGESPPRRRLVPRWSTIWSRSFGQPLGVRGRSKPGGSRPRSSAGSADAAISSTRGCNWSPRCAQRAQHCAPNHIGPPPRCRSAS